MASLIGRLHELVERHQQLLTDLMPVFLLIPILFIGLGHALFQETGILGEASRPASNDCDLEYFWCVTINEVDDRAGPTQAREACAACETRGTPQPR